jgi:hypothetical protein
LIEHGLDLGSVWQFNGVVRPPRYVRSGWTAGGDAHGVAPFR